MQGLDVGAVVHYTCQYQDDNVSLTFSPKAQCLEVDLCLGVHGKCGSGLRWISSLGMQNVVYEDPPFVGGSGENGYDESLATINGRFRYVQLKKRF
jgi:hypothetical protein